MTNPNGSIGLDIWSGKKQSKFRSGPLERGYEEHLSLGIAIILQLGDDLTKKSIRVSKSRLDNFNCHKIHMHIYLFQFRANFVLQESRIFW